MISFAQLTQIADKDGVDSTTVERDYVLMQVLAALYSSRRSSDLVFKGGTLLRACYFDDYRYSADLDFSTLDGDSTSALAAIDSVLADCRESVGFDELELTTTRGLSHVVYRRPQGRRGRIKINAVDDELVENPVSVRLLARYDDVDLDSDLLAYSLLEVTSEKLRCIIQRLQARDLFDLHRLLVAEGIDATEAWGMFERKAKHKGLDARVLWEHLERKLPRYQQKWDDELANYIQKPPPFQRVERETMRVLRSLR